MVDDGTLFENGRVYPAPASGERTDALLVEQGHVVALGKRARERARPDVRSVDLQGRTLLPGFNDAHMHLLSLGIRGLETELSGATDTADAIERLLENAATTPSGEWVLGFGYDESTWPADDRRLLTREELDGVSTDHPIAAQRIDGHSLTLNTPGLERMGFAGDDAGVRTDADGRPTGVVVEAAVGRVREAVRPSGTKARAALGVAVDRAHRHGVTTLQTMAGLTPPREHGNDTLRAVVGAFNADELPIRITAWIYPRHTESIADLELAGGFGNDRVRIGGIKRFADGSIGSQTAKLATEFADDPGNDGEMVMDAAELSETAAATARAGLPVATHAIGGTAIDAVIDNYADVIASYQQPDPLLRIEHIELASDEGLDRMASLDIVASMQPNFLQWSAPGELYETRLGADRLGTDNRFRAVLDAGIDLAFGSDNMPFGPLYGIHRAVNTPFDTQRITVEEAIAAYTEGSATAEGTADRKGRLEPGMLADAVVLDRDPFDHPDTIEDIGVAMTVVDGRIVYDRQAST